MSNVIQLFAANNVVDFATKQPIQTQASNVDNSLAARRAHRSGSTEVNSNVIVAFTPRDCA